MHASHKPTTRKPTTRIRLVPLAALAPPVSHRERLPPLLARAIEAVPKADWFAEQEQFRRLAASRVDAWAAVLLGEDAAMSAAMPPWLSSTERTPSALLAEDSAPASVCKSEDRDDRGLDLTVAAVRSMKGPAAAAWSALIAEPITRRNTIMRDLQRVYWPLIVRIARPFLPHPGAQSMSLGDLFAYGLPGLRVAMLRFDLAKGFMFTTYATWWIRHSISAAVNNYGRIVRLPVGLCEAGSKIAAARRSLAAKRVEESAEAIAAETGLTARRVEATLEAMRGADNVVIGRHGNDHEAVPGAWAFMASERTIQGDHALARRDDTVLAHRLLAVLPATQREVVMARCGFGDAEAPTFAEIAEARGVTTQAVNLAWKAGIKNLAAVASAGPVVEAMSLAERHAVSVFIRRRAAIVTMSHGAQLCMV